MVRHSLLALVRTHALRAASAVTRASATARSPNRHARLAWLLLVTGTTGIGAAACRRSTTEATLPGARPTPSVESEPPALDAAVEATSEGEPLRPSSAELPDVQTDWCLEGWRGLDEATCYLVPEGWDRQGRRRLLVYLSGIVPPVTRSPQKEKVQRIVAAAARRAGVVALLPRGRRGIGPKDARDWWAWPTSAADHEAHATTMVAEWSVARAKLEGALGAFERTYLAGSSSGAYFLTALALGGAVEMDGYAATSGGAKGQASRHASSVKRRPFYVSWASGDPTNGGPKGLGAFLSANGWPVRVAEHPGGHGAREVYLDEAFAFWDEWERDAGAEAH